MAKKKIKIVSWNVNGIRAVMKKGFVESLQGMDADICAVQETKIQEQQLTDAIVNIDGYHSIWGCATVKKGYSGVALYTKEKPRSTREGFGISEYDEEGRVIEADYGDFILFNVYFPNGQMNPERLDYKLRFYEDFFEYVDNYKKEGRSIIVTGDYNTAHNEIDLKNPKENEKYSGFLRIERDALDKIVENGYVDTFRYFYPDIEKYSWWSYRFKARERNIGWRIDYFFVSKDLIDNGYVKEAFIDNDIYGSDHCPIGILLEIG